MPQHESSKPWSDSTEARYPNVARWVRQHGWIEIGYDDFSHSFARALDIGGIIWEGAAETDSLEVALDALDAGIAAWLEKNRMES
jgi:hypothetical protein